MTYSEPVVPCQCKEGWKHIDAKYCNECFEGQIDRLRNALKEISKLGASAYADGSPAILIGKIADDALAFNALHFASSPSEKGESGLTASSIDLDELQSELTDTLMLQGKLRPLCFKAAEAIAQLRAALTSPAAPRVDGEHHKLDTDRQVFFYEQDFYVLSNFSSFSLWLSGMRFATSEAAYHYEKFPDATAIQQSILNAPSAHEAFKIAEVNKALRRADWDDVKVDVMRDILRAKVQQHEYVRRKLLATGDRELIEDSWRDDFWGWGPNRDGQNMLGKLWMEVRAELRSGSLAASPTRVKAVARDPAQAVKAHDAWALIRAERRRQVEVEGWTEQHDDEHADGEMELAASLYYRNTRHQLMMREDGAPLGWPWDSKWWKPKDKVRDLVRAGALYLAEQERLRRLPGSLGLKHDRAAQMDKNIKMVVAALREVLGTAAPSPVSTTAPKVDAVAWRYRDTKSTIDPNWHLTDEEPANDGSYVVEALGVISPPPSPVAAPRVEAVAWRETAARIIDGVAFRPINVDGPFASETTKEHFLRRRNSAYHKADQICLSSPPPSHVSPPDELTRENIRTRAAKMLIAKDWKPGSSISFHSAMELLTAFGMDLSRRPETDRCSYPECGCDDDAVCNEGAKRLTPPSPVSPEAEGLRPPFLFRRYVNGIKMAEDVEITHASTVHDAFTRARQLYGNPRGMDLVLEVAAAPSPEPAIIGRNLTADERKGIERALLNSGQVVAELFPVTEPAEVRRAAIEECVGACNRAGGFFAEFSAQAAAIRVAIDFIRALSTAPAAATQAGEDAWQPIETAPRDGSPIEVCNTRHPMQPPVIVRWLNEFANPDAGWCDAATPSGDALYYNPHYFDYWKPTTPVPTVPSALTGSKEEKL